MITTNPLARDMSILEVDILNDIKKLCNYKEDDTQGKPVVNVSYLDMVTEVTEEELLKQKSENRELAIDIITGEKSEQDWDNRNNISILEDRISRIGMKVLQMSIKGKKYNHIEEIKNELIDTIESITQGIHPNKNLPTLDVTLANDYEVDQQKIITKVVSSGNMIAVHGRRGPATTLLVHPETMKYFNNNIYNIGVTVITSTKITRNKVISLRASTADSPGIILINSPEQNTYYTGLTTNAINQFMWFYIK